MSLLLAFIPSIINEDYIKPNNQNISLNEKNDSAQSADHLTKSLIQIEALDTTIMCVQGLYETELVIRNQTEYEKLLEIRSPHPDCRNYTLPPIDFKKYILIGIRRSSAGDYLTFDKQIFYHDETFVINYQITQHGNVEILNHVRKYFLIKKIDSQDYVEFKYTKKYEED